MTDGLTFNPKWDGNPATYLNGKLRILTDRRGFGIVPTETEMLKRIQMNFSIREWRNY